jgi:transcriptional regulator with XRE-family HTH domain
MIIGDRLFAVRREKKLSQGDIERRTGLLRCYISRVENGHTVPSVETLEKFARALEIPIYRLFYEGTKSPDPPKLPSGKSNESATWGSGGKDVRILHKLRSLLSQMGNREQQILLYAAQKMAARKK